MLDLDRTITAVQGQLAQWQDALANATLAVELHRDHLGTPAAQLKPIEEQAQTALKAIKWLEAKLAQLQRPAHRIAVIVEQIAALQAELARLQAGEDAPKA